MVNVILIGASDQHLERLLHACGARVRTAPIEHLHTLAASPAAPSEVVVVDHRGRSVIPAAVTALRRQHASTSVIMVASALDPAFLLDAMRAGVNEVIADPVTQQTLEEALTRVEGSRPASEGGRVFVFMGAKGGVGTTTVSVNTAATLGRMSKPERTLLMDLHDGTGDAAVFVGAEPQFTVADAVENIHRLDLNFFRSLVTQMAPYADLLASPGRMAPGVITADRLRRVIEFAKSAYRFTVIDLPRADLSILDSIDGVTGVFLVVNQELATIRSAVRLLPALRQRHGDVLRVVLSRADRHAGISTQDVEKALGTRIAEQFPNDYRVALHALNVGRPLALDGQHELATSFTRFAATLAGTNTHAPLPVKAGLFARLSPRRA